MFSFRIILLIFGIVSQTFAGHPHRRLDDDFDMTYFQRLWQQRTMQELPSYVKNQIPRVPAQLTERLPVASSVLSMSKENLMNFPMDVAMKALSEVCHTAISTETLNPTYTPELNEIHMHRMNSDGKDVFVPLEQFENLFNRSDLNMDNDKTTVIYITSWKWDINDSNDALNVLRQAFRCRGIDNFLIIDAGNLIYNYQAYQTLNTEIVGQWVSDVLLRMKERYPNVQMHLIGHGIGAHVAAVAGRRFEQKTGELLPRITGLDPAMLCYKNSEKVIELQKGDAKFVDIIHSNSYGLGNPVPMGDVDFYPNYRRLTVPGCTNVMCAHEMAVRYFAESVLPGFEENFISMKYLTKPSLSTNYRNYDYEYMRDTERVPMGYSTPKNIKGTYYLETNPQYPYGKNVRSDSTPKCVKETPQTI